ncbi:MAG TPA: BON domain-containing protein [Steroidobacteraceae bacterium]|jgi:hyperosmotically inducible protein|nr:BON domain-containing protein [Steroidobacteraceae bacterium]
MSFKSTLTGLVAITALLGGAAFAQDVDLSQSNHKAFVKDSVITTKVKTKLASEHMSSLAKIHVDTDADGIVWLSGTAPTRDAAERAVTLARATEGVVSVKSAIRVAGDR